MSVGKSQILRTMKTEWEERVQFLSYSSVFYKKKNKHLYYMSYGWQLICFSRLWSSSDRTLKILSLKHVAFCSTALAQAWCSAGHCAGLVLLELLHHMTPDVAILFPFIIFLLILIVFFLFVCLFKISFSSRVNLASSWLRGSVKWDSTTAWCAVSEHNAVLHQGVGALQTAAMILVFWVQHSEPQEKFPASTLRACSFLLSSQTQIVCDMGQS